MKQLSKIALLVGFAALTVVFTLGCDGVSGPRGPIGDVGDGGPDYLKPAPTNRFFSLAVTNNSQRSHNGAPKLYLAFDGNHQAAGDTIACQRLQEGKVPAIDGLDGGSDEWGQLATTVNLIRAAGNFNFIESALVRSAFDNDYVYFQVQWTEVANEDFGLEISRSENPIPWIYPDSMVADTAVNINLGRWDKGASNEDRLNLLFEISPVTRYESDGCYVTCHTTDENETNYHATRAARERMDIWHWTAGSTNFTGYGYDRYLDHTSTGVRADVGTPVVRPNRDFDIAGADTTDRPLYQAFGQPGFSKAYPLWEYEITRVANSGWTAGTMIPSFVNSIPTLSAGDLIAVGGYNNGTWTVELKRKRLTGNGDDVQF